MDFKKAIEIVKNADRIVFDEKALHQTITKGFMDYATGIDVGVQKYVTGALAEAYPGIQLLGEEEKNLTLDYEKPMWILDPIDGTNNLMFHMQLSAVSLGYLENGEIRFGIVYNPFTGECYTAERGKGAFLNGEQIHVCNAPDLSKCMVSVGTSPYDRELADVSFDKIKRIFRKCIDIRRFGSAELELCYVAAGRTGAFFEERLRPWDYAAGSVILEEAGGKVSGTDGLPLQYRVYNSVLATNGRIHEEMLELLK